MGNINGNEITNVFKYVQQVFRECQQLIYKTDALMAPDWRYSYGSRITRDVTSSIQDPDRWLVQAIFRVYENVNEPNVNKAITITFWEDGDFSEPVITAGKIIYSDISKRGHWDLWDIWFRWEDENEENQYELDGKVNSFKTKECNYINEAKIFSYPLVSIENDTELENKIIRLLKSL